MQASIQPFTFGQNTIRTLTIGDAVWFVATDVAEALGYLTAKDASRHLDADEKGRQIVPTPGGQQEVTIINESGLYALVLRSRKPEARKFAKWVTGEVLPAIRKTGSYGQTQTPALPLTGQATQAAYQAAHQYIDDVRANPHSHTGSIPVQVLQGVLADALMSQRFLLSIRPGHGLHLQAVPEDAYVLPASQWASAIESGDAHLPPEELARLANVCTQRMARALQRRLPPSQPPALA